MDPFVISLVLACGTGRIDRGTTITRLARNSQARMGTRVKRGD